MSAEKKKKNTGGYSRTWQKKYYWRKGDAITREDQAMLDVLICKAKELGYVPTKKQVPNAEALRRRFGNWPRALEAAGLPRASDSEQGRKRSAAREQEQQTEGQAEEPGDGSP